jgi:hypothetical protein
LIGCNDSVVSELLVHDYSVSELSRTILRQEGDIVQVAADVLERARATKTGATDAMNMWTGVVQTCFHAVKRNRTLSIVMSARVFWYVRLVVEVVKGSPRCSIEISDGYRVGVPKFMRTLVQLLVHSSDADKGMSDEDIWLWSVAIDGKADDGVDAEVEVAGDAEDEGGNGTGDNKQLIDRAWCS